MTASFKDKAKPRQRAEETLQEEEGLNLDEKKKDYDPDFEELDREEEEKISLGIPKRSRFLQVLSVGCSASYRGLCKRMRWNQRKSAG